MSRRPAVLATALLLLLVVAWSSLAFGSSHVPMGRVWHLLWTPDDSQQSVTVRDLRVPRTVVGIATGMALGMAGALMQTLTRNPLADPGVLGVNAGAAFAVVVAVSVTQVTSVGFYVWFALGGAAAAVGAVYLLGSAGAGGPGRAGATPARLALAGVAITAAVGALVQTVILTNQAVFNEFRFWAAGSLEGRGLSVTATVAPFLLVGAALAFGLAPRLNALALGDDTGRSLGVDVRRTRLLAVGSIALLSAGATAAVGPIGFIGLGVPYVARALCGSDQRWVLPCSAVLGAVFLLVADILGRLVAGAQTEVQAGIVTAILGGPIFVLIVRRRQIEAL